jgi:peptidase C39-like protein
MTKRWGFLVCVAAVLGLIGTAPALAAQPYPLNFKTFALNVPSDPSSSGTVFSGGSLQLASSGLGALSYTDPYAFYASDGVTGTGDYVSGTWTSGVTNLSFGFNELVSSWNANTPPGTWIEVSVLPRLDDGHWAAKPYVLGRWSSDDYSFHRTSVGGQGNADGFVSIDTWFAKDHPAIAYRLLVTLYRKTTATSGPTLSRLSAIASNLTNQKGSFPSKTTMNGVDGVDLAVPQYSQEIHHGDFPQYDNGGEAWCSPTSTAMVVAYWSQYSVTHSTTDYRPTPTEYSWVTSPPLPAGHQDPWVDYTARAVYDYHYNGAGNWPFNAAYAASRGLVADVTQLHNLAEAEPFLKAGIPLVASVAWSSNKLDGAIKSTNGHLLVIKGMTPDGKQVIVNDPASIDDSAVKHYYDREQFERAWIPASGGIVYVIRPVAWQTAAVNNLLTQNNS